MEVTFRNYIRLSRLTPLKKYSEVCTKTYKDPVGHSKHVVVHEITVARGQVYIEQTGRCFSERAMKHKCNIASQLASLHLSVTLQESNNCYVCCGTCAFLDLERNPHKKISKSKQ